MDSKQPVAVASSHAQLTRDTSPMPEHLSLDGPRPPYAVETSDDSASGTGLIDYWRILARHKFLIIGAGFGGLLAGIAIGIPLKPVFRASTSLEVLNVNQDFMNMRPTQPSIAGADSESLSEEETQAALLESDPLLDRVSEKLNPHPTPPAPLASSGWRSWFHLFEPRKPSPRERLLAGLAKKLKVSNTPRTRILTLTVDSTDSQLAKDYLNTLVGEFIKENVNARWASTQETSGWLSQELNEARSRLQRSEDSLQAYAHKSNLFFTDQETQTNVATEKLQQLQQQLSAAAADRIARQTSYELAKSSSPDTLADVLNDASLQTLRAHLDDANRQFASLSALYNPGYSKLKQAQAEVTTAREAFNRQRADLLSKIETDYQSALRREKLLASAYDAQAKEVAGQDERTVQYNMLKREVESNRQLYDTMLQQMKQSSIATALRASNVRVINAAYLQDRPVFPNPPLNAALGMFCGFLFSAVFVTLRDKADRTLRQPGDVKYWTALPELGSIPRASLALTGDTSTTFSNKVSFRKPTRRPVLNLPESVNASGSTKLLNSATPFVESFNSALTSILIATGTGASGNALVFTSAEPADGKTSVASNVAIAAARIGKRVLLIDADLRRPKIHEVFGARQDGGLSDVLFANDAEPSSRWRELVQQSGVPGLGLLTSGRPGAPAVHLFYSRQFSVLLRDCKQEYDLVLIDTPPAMQITDARVIAGQVDGVVLVARAEQTSRDALLALRDRLKEDRIYLLGCILNDWDPKQAPHAYSYDKAYYAAAAHG